MKDQYFGDVNDFRKYALLRQVAPGLRLGVCWMLTVPEPEKTDGRFLSYLDRPENYRCYDPELYDWLRKVVGVEKDRRVVRIEESNLLGTASFYSSSKSLGDDRGAREAYFAECARQLAGCDLVFFDPDTGFEIESIPRGRKNSCKYLYWDEACATFKHGSSVMVYQHFARERREAYVARVAGKFGQQTGASGVFSFRTPQVLFLLATQEQHVVVVRRELARIRSCWGPKQIVAREHVASTEGVLPPSP